MRTGLRPRAISNACGRVVDACLVVSVLVAPLWFGGRHDLGRFLYATVCATAACAWTLRCLSKNQTTLRRTPVHWLMLLAVLMVAVQLIPLPERCLSWLSPELSQLAPTWCSSSGFPCLLGQWSTVSVTPGSTGVGLAVLISHCLLFVVALERLHDFRDIRRLLQLLALAAVIMSVLGLLQWLTATPKLLWLYQPPQRAIGPFVQGTFVNKNHFAHFIILGLGPLLLSLRPTKVATDRKGARQGSNQNVKWRQLAVRIAIVLCLVAVLLSLSRGAIVTLVVACLAGGSVLAMRGLIGRRSLIGCACLAVVTLLGVSLGSSEKVLSCFGELASGSVEELDEGGGRRELWAANLSAVAANPWLGYGVGSHADVYRAFASRSFAVEFTHAESGYLHTLTECGIVGGLLLMGIIGLMVRPCLQATLSEMNPQHRFTWAALIASLTASLTHSIFDFVWYVPACMSVTVLLAACVTRMHQLGNPIERKSKPRANTGSYRPWQDHLTWWPRAGFVLAGIAACCLLWGPGMASIAWDRYQLAAAQERALRHREFSTGLDEGSRAHLEMLQARMISSLHEVVHWYPGHARAHLRLAGRLQQRFQAEQHKTPNNMSLFHVRDAALASDFQSFGDTQAWLARALGDGSSSVVEAYRHTRYSLRLAPLQADGYTYLANLSFLSPPSQRDTQSLFDQALLISPHDGGVLFEAGRQAMIDYQVERSINLWKRAHQAPGVHRLQIAAQLAQYLPAGKYLAEFSPDLPTLRTVHRLYAERKSQADLSAVAKYAEGLADIPEQGLPARRRRCRAWGLASRIYHELDDAEQETKCAELAYAALPTDYTSRHCLTMAYSHSGRLDEAAPHARWCLARNPSDPIAKRVLIQIEKQRGSRLSAARTALAR